VTYKHIPLLVQQCCLIKYIWVLNYVVPFQLKFQFCDIQLHMLCQAGVYEGTSYIVVANSFCILLCKSSFS
jgi:hypothetical protein